ncbi:hypothetical protein NN561_014205 [Cricetulus griseus]
MEGGLGFQCIMLCGLNRCQAWSKVWSCSLKPEGFSMCEPAMAVGGKLQRMDRHSSHASYIDFAVEPMHVRLSAVNVTVTVEPGFYSSVSSEVICGTGDDVPQMVKEAENEVWAQQSPDWDLFAFSRCSHPASQFADSNKVFWFKDAGLHLPENVTLGVADERLGPSGGPRREASFPGHAARLTRRRRNQSHAPGLAARSPCQARAERFLCAGLPTMHRSGKRRRPRRRSSRAMSEPPPPAVGDRAPRRQPAVNARPGRPGPGRAGEGRGRRTGGARRRRPDPRERRASRGAAREAAGAGRGSAGLGDARKRGEDGGSGLGERRMTGAAEASWRPQRPAAGVG